MLHTGSSDIQVLVVYAYAYASYRFWTWPAPTMHTRPGFAASLLAVFVTLWPPANYYYYEFVMNPFLV